MDWKLDWDTDVGPDDDYYIEWWTVSRGEQIFRCDSKTDAEWLCNLLNSI
jgi:hypothetical protein